MVFLREKLWGNAKIEECAEELRVVSKEKTGDKRMHRMDKGRTIVLNTNRRWTT
jgi:hypothetical protein